MAVPKILYDNRFRDAVPVASTTAAGTLARNVADARPYTWWKPTALPATLTVDCDTAKAADTACIVAHNLASMGCDVQIRGSTDGFSASDVLVASVTPSTDGPVWSAFASVSYRYWRLRIDGPGTPAIDYDFAGTKTLQAAVTFTRADAATCASYWDSAGAMQTAAANVARFDHHPVSGESLGLLIEESRTNLLLNSATLSTQSVTTSATAYTLSFYGTGTVTLSGSATAGPLVGTNDKQRVSLTFTPTAGTLTLTVSGSVRYANLEAGSFATSWISTAGASRTRAADSATVTGASFTAFWNATAGTLYRETRVDGGLLGSAAAVASTKVDGTAGNAIEMRYVRDNPVTGAYQDVTGVTASVTQFDTANLPAAHGRTYRQALAFAANDIATSVDGGTVGTDASATLPTVTSMTVLSSAASSATIARLTYWPKRLTDAQLQWLTAADRGTITEPSVAIVMIGAALTLPTGLEAPFDPIGRKLDGRRINNNNGQPLGSLVDYSRWEQSITLRAVSWSWVRTSWLTAFNAALQSEPFIFSWDPGNYPDEARLVTTDGDFSTPHRSGSLTDLTVNLRGVA
jgi:hypothetical protein